MKYIGIDLIEIGEFKKFLISNRFMARAFTSGEIGYCSNRIEGGVKSYAGHFAAKEAFMKALGTGWNNGVQWSQIEVAHDLYGKPLIHLNGKALCLFKERGFNNTDVSISHSTNYCIAVVALS